MVILINELIRSPYIIAWCIFIGQFDESHCLALSIPRALTRVSVPGSVTGVVGFPVAVPCDLTPPTPGDSPHLILWYKNIFGTPIYSVDMRNGLESASHWRDKSVFGDRVDFVVNSNNNNSSIASELRFNTVNIG